ncbi:copper transporter [Stylonychia lemnae]|uniref:Copper transport protein n=1 Tax=Stylonychia lemnae TaxID=5949 RepID=A0A078AKN0_STYLE|nr:copper transporter [Stylonychia lemnae]|eukprot:CDW82002.1 copper transporter [Stylonychia lemnae]
MKYHIIALSLVLLSAQIAMCPNCHSHSGHQMKQSHADIVESNVTESRMLQQNSETEEDMEHQMVGMMMMQILRTENTGTYILSLVITFCIAVAIEGLNFLRYHLQASAYSKLNEFIIAWVYLLSIFLSYMLMLIVMTFNGGIFIVTVLGLTTGYFIFGFIRKTKYARIYNPEGDKCCAEVDA